MAMQEISKISREFRKKNGTFNVDLAFVIQFYDAYLREKNLAVVASTFGVTPWNLQKIIERHTELQLAMTMADENRRKGILANYILSNLSHTARATWEKITKLSTYEEIEAVFKKHPVKLRQQLFCTAILYTGHDNSKALRMVGIDYNHLTKWKQDAEFLQMLEEVQWHKKQFFQKALIGLVAEGHPGAVVFVNRTVNADMGYSERLDLNVQGQAGNDVRYELEQLDLPVEVLKTVLEAIERKNKEDGITDAEEVPEFPTSGRPMKRIARTPTKG
jgi:hypothetical protein